MTSFILALFDLIVQISTFALAVAAFVLLGLGIAGLAQMP